MGSTIILFRARVLNYGKMEMCTPFFLAITESAGQGAKHESTRALRCSSRPAEHHH
jgi:hypothetical protein